MEIFREHTELSGLDNNHARAFNISYLSDISLEDYESFSPAPWPITQDAPNGTKRLFNDGHFFTPNNRVQLIPITGRYPAVKAGESELIMNTGRFCDQWHTMTGTGKASRLLSHTSEPSVQMHPRDAKRLQLKENYLVELTNRNSR